MMLLQSLIRQNAVRQDRGRGQGFIERVNQIAQARGVPMAQIALAWLLSRSGVTAPIVGATKPHHLEDAATSVSLALSKEETDALQQPYIPHSVGGFS